MKNTFAALAFTACALANPMPQAVTSAIAPEAPTPSGCSESYDGSFQITVLNVTSSSKRDVEKRQQDGILTLKLADGSLTDQAGRTGYIASNYQFQFDSPPQAGAIYTSGFSLCSNNSLALGGSSIFYQCLSGDFHNLYDRHWAEQCSPIYLVALIGGGGGTAPTEISDGQPQVPTNNPITQISDGQPQYPTAPPPVTQISDGQPQVPSAAPPPVTQISDGQPQVPSAGPPVTQISDGQPQVPSGPAITQISDGQPQVPSGPVISQISDGQPQVPSAPPVTQISDGQPQAPIATSNYTFTGPSPPEFTGAAASPIYGLGALAAGLMGAVALL